MRPNQGLLLCQHYTNPTKPSRATNGGGEGAGEGGEEATANAVVNTRVLLLTLH